MLRNHMSLPPCRASSTYQALLSASFAGMVARSWHGIVPGGSLLMKQSLTFLYNASMKALMRHYGGFGVVAETRLDPGPLDCRRGTRAEFMHPKQGRTSKGVRSKTRTLP